MEIETSSLPYGVAQQLEDLRGSIRGAEAALASGSLESWEIREFEAVKENSSAKLAKWESNIAAAFAA
jgi:hypothetical protein